MNKHTICCFPNLAYLSETSRMISAFRELQRLGCDVCLATHGGTYESVLKQEKIPYEIVEPTMDAERCEEFVRKNTPQEGIRSAFNLHFYRSVNELKDFVVSEANFFEKREIRVVLSGFSLSNVLSSRMAKAHYAVTHLGSFVPPVMERKMIPPRDDFSMITRILPGSWARWLVNRIYLKSKIYTKQFNIVARELGIEPVRTTMDLFMGDTTFITDVPQIVGIPEEDIENWKQKNPSSFSRYPPRLKYAGAIYARLFGDFDEEVAAHLETDKPKIYVALTSSTRKWLFAVLDALKDVDAVIVMVTTNYSGLDSNHPHILFREYLPSHKVMPLVDLAIIHGGQGSVQTAIASGTPIIGFPLQTEQHFNLSLVEQHGAGICMSLKKLEQGYLRPVIERITSNPSYKRSMETLRGFQEKRNGPRIVAEELKRIAEALP